MGYFSRGEIVRSLYFLGVRLLDVAASDGCGAAGVGGLHARLLRSPGSVTLVIIAPVQETKSWRNALRLASVSSSAEGGGGARRGSPGATGEKKELIFLIENEWSGPSVPLRRCPKTCGKWERA